MNEQTVRLRSELEEIMRRGKELVASVDDAVLTRRPAEGSWSAAECIEHLNISAEKYVRRFRRALDAGPKLAPRAQEKLTWRGRFFVWLAEPPPRRKLAAPRGYAPQSAPPREELVARYVFLHAELIRMLEESDAIDRSKILVNSPASRYIKLRLLDGYSLLTAHARRHLWQAERAIA